MGDLRSSDKSPAHKTPSRRRRDKAALLNSQTRPALEALEPRLLLDGMPAGLVSSDELIDWSVPATHIDITSGQHPSGSLMYSGGPRSTSDVEVINWLGETEIFSFDVDPGQTITVLAEPRNSQLDLVLALKDTNGALIATADGTGAGEAELVQLVGPTDSGTYTLGVTSIAGIGSYDLVVYLNAAMEEENIFAAPNDSPQTAQDLDSGFIELTGQAERAGVIASLPLEDATVLLEEGFESGSLGQAWTTYSSDPSGRVLVTDETYPSPPEGLYALKMFREGHFDYPTLNEAVWTVDLSGQDQALLWFQYKASYGSSESFDGDFVGHAYADGIAISNDGVHWHPIWNGPGSSYTSWRTFGIDLAGAAAAAGMDLGPDLRIKFQDTDNTYEGGDFRAWDDIHIVAPARDWYSFTLDAGDSATLVVADTAGGGWAPDFNIDLYDEYGNPIVVGREVPGGVGEVVAAISGFRAEAGGTYFARVTSDHVHDNYNLVITRNADFHLYRSNDPTPQPMGASGVVLGYAGTAWWDEGDMYYLPVEAGDSLTLTTLTPFDALLDPDNICDPAIDLFGPDGTLVASDNDSAPDGKNAMLEYTAATGGVYTVRVYSGAYDKGGPYVLQAEGYTGSFPFVATATDPATDAYLDEAPARMTVDFSDFILIGSLEASDLTINGIAATGYTVIDGDTVIFELPAGLADGPHQVAIAAGAILDVQGGPIEAYNGQFTLDRVGPRVTGSSISEGQILPPGELTYVAQFDEQLDATNLDETDFSLTGRISGEYTPASWLYDPAGSTLTLEYSGLPDDAYTLTLFSGDGRFEDLAGNDLDGEPVAFPIPPNVSGDGVQGGDFIVNFGLDGLISEWTAPLVASEPFGSLVYQSEQTGALQGLYDIDAYWLGLDEGQTVTVAIEPDTDLWPCVYLLRPDNTLMAYAVASAPGADALIQTSTVTLPGNHMIVIIGKLWTSGAYRARLVLNAAAEDEEHGGAANDDLASAQDLDASFVDLGGGVMRAAALGENLIILNEGFESGQLGPEWTVYAEDGASVEVTDYTSHEGEYSLALHGGGNNISPSEATLTVDLAGARPDRLQFHLSSRYASTFPFPGDFTGHVNANGIAASTDGVNWHPVFNFEETGDEYFHFHDIDLGAELEASGLLPASTLYLRFQHYGQYSHGQTYDSIVLTSRTEDWYSFSLTGGESATLGLVAPDGGNVDLRLYDASGDVVAVGAEASGDYDLVVESMNVPATGVYYARVIGDFDYSLIVTRSATLDTEQDGGMASEAQDITAAAAALGSVAFPADPITTEIEPNDAGNDWPYLDDFTFANDLTTSFTQIEPGIHEAVVTGNLPYETMEDRDFFKVHARPGDLFCLRLEGVSPWVGIYNNTGKLLNYNYSSRVTTTYADQFEYAGDYYILARGGENSDYTLTVTLTAEAVLIPNYDDFYSIEVNAGDDLVLETATPFDGPFAIDNDLDPLIELYDPSGALVAGDDNGGPDGRNALLWHTAAESGTYTIRVLPASGSGEYVLRAAGYTGSLPALTVEEVDPPDGSQLTAEPVQMTVAFSDAVLFSSLDAADLTIDGVPSVGFTAIDYHTVVFDLPVGLGDGVHDAVIAAGSVLALTGAPVQAFSSQYILDATPPTVIASSLSQGDVLLPGDLTATIRFSEELLWSDVDERAFSLVGRTGGQAELQTWNYDPATSTLTLEYSNLTEDTYTLGLHSGDARLEDLFGNDLDGEASSWPIPPGVSGDGVPGGDFVVHFAVDPGIFSELPSPFEHVGPASGLIYGTNVSSTIGWSSDVDVYSVALDAGQTISVAAHPRDGLQPRIIVVNAANLLIGMASSPAPGMDALIQNAEITMPGTHYVVVLGTWGTSGAYNLAITLNAALEAEEHQGPGNDDRASAADLEDGFVDLDGAGQVAGVVGALPATDGSILISEDFSEDELSGDWSTYSSGTGEPRLYVSTYYDQRTAYLYLDHTTSAGQGYAEAVWSVNLADADEAILQFSYNSYWERYPYGFDGPFTGHYYADGIAVSEDGITWHPIWEMPSADNSNWHDQSIDLAAAADAAGITLGPDFRIRFQNYGSEEISSRPAGYKDLVIFTPSGLRSVAGEGFEDGSLGDEWSTWSSDQAGSIYISGDHGTFDGSQALVMHGDSEGTDVLNEAVWDVDLSGSMTQARLSFAYTDYGHRPYGTPGDFEDHVNYTCVSISADGRHWHTVWYSHHLPDGGTPADGQWRRYTIDLAAEADEFGIPLGTPLRIKFQGYSYNAMPDGLLVWDDISIDVGEDWYQFSLDAGESATLAMESLTDENVDLALFDSAGRLLALGAEQGENADEFVADFVAPSAGDYYARISSYDTTDYSLVVTRGAAMDAEQNNNENLDDLATAQDITHSGTALGHLRGMKNRLFLSDNKHIYEMDPITGEILNSYSSLIETYYNHGGLASTRSTLFVGGDSCRIKELNADTGEYIREIYVNVYNHRGLAFLNDEIYVLLQEKIQVYDYDTGEMNRVLDVPELRNADALAASESALYGIRIKTLYQVDPLTGDATELGQLDGIQLAYGLGILGNELFVVDYSSEDKLNVYNLSDLTWKRTIATRSYAGVGADGGLGGHDYYSVQANAGDVLTITTSTPGDGPFDFANDLDPAVELYDPSGALVASDDNGADDGRNAQLAYAAPVGGTYTVRIYNVAGSGHYVLNVGGHTGSPADFRVAEIDLPDGTLLGEVPTRITVDFSDPVLLTSLGAGSVRVDGQAAVRMTVIDADSAVFDLPAGLGHGLHEILIASGAVRDLQGTPITEFTSRFTVDLIAPRIVESSIQQGQTVLTGDRTIAIRFDEALLETQLDAEDFSLVSEFNGSFEPSAWSYEAVTSTLTLEYSDLPKDRFTLTLTSGDGAIEDLVGNDLDGEALEWPIPPYLSGDGVAGGDFVLDFQTDVLIAEFPALQAVDPLGSLIYSGQVTGELYSLGDQDIYTLNLEDGEMISVVVHPDRDLKPTVSLVDPANQQIAEAAAAEVGTDAVANNVTIAARGVYFLVVAGANGTDGTYTVEVVLNAAVETESHDGPTNDDLASAQDLDASAVDIGGGADRLAAMGGIGIVAGADFETGRLGPGWSMYASNVDGIIEVTDEWGAAFGSGALLMLGRYPAIVSNYSLKEAVWTLDLSGLTDTRLTFWHAGGLGYQSINPVYEDFVGHIDGDTVAISDDGVNWHPVWIPGTPLGTTISPTGWYEYTIDLADEAANAGMTLGPDFRIKFQDYGERNHERLWDETVISIPDAADIYRFDLDAGQTATIGVNSLKVGDAQVELLDASGTLLAVGQTGTTNLDQVISDFKAPTDGTYYLRVTGDSGAEYSLVVTRGADLDTESNHRLESAQDITSSGVALGGITDEGLGRLFQYSYYDGDWIVETDPLTGKVIRNFASPVPSRYSYLMGIATTESSILLARDADKPIYELRPDSWEVIRTIPNPAETSARGMAYLNDEIFLLLENQGKQIVVLDYATGAMKRTLDLSSFSYSLYQLASDGTRLLGASRSRLYEIDPLTGSPTELMTFDDVYCSGLGVVGNEIFVANDFYDNYDIKVFDLNTLEPTRVLDRGSLGTSMGGDRGPAHDYYTVEVIAGDELTISTTTPGAGPGAFDNDLDPVIELYDPSGALVAGDDNSAPDGRNALLTHLADSSGAYTVKVLSVPGTGGEYVLSVAGYTGEIEPFTVQATDPVDGAELTYDPAQMTIDFSAGVLLTSLDASDLTIGDASATGYTVIDGDTIAFDLPSLDEGVYDVAIMAGAIESVGGEPIEAYAGELALRIFEYPTPLQAAGPSGSLVHTGEAVTALIPAAADTSSHTLSLDAGQMLTVTVEADEALQSIVELFAPDGSLLAAATAGGNGQAVLLQNIAITTAGRHVVIVSGADGTTGQFTIHLTLNAAVEQEGHSDQPNDEPAQAQDIDGSFLDLDGGLQRGAVVGDASNYQGAPTHAENFESGLPGPEWTTYGSNSNSRIIVTDKYGASEGQYALIMDSDYSSVLNEAIWTVDLTGLSRAFLNFMHRSWNDDIHQFTGDFTDHYNADGIAVSNDGVNWHPVWNAPWQGDDWEQYTIDLAAGAAEAGMVLGADFRIKFQQYGYYAIASDGRGWDDITITRGVDWYSFTLEADQAVAIVLDSDTGEALNLEFYDSSGALLAVGQPGPRTYADVTEEFVGESLSWPQMAVIGPDGNLYVSDSGNDNVLRFDGRTGDFIDEFVPSESGGLNTPYHLTFGPDGNLYITAYKPHGHDYCVFRYDGQTGEFMDIFASGLRSYPFGLTFGPDGNLYVSNSNYDNVLRFDGQTGELIDEFVSRGSGGLDTPKGLTFGPDGNLYVASYDTSKILRFDGRTGEFIDNFVPAWSGGMSAPTTLAFGPDERLYVGSYNSRDVLAFDGISGEFLEVVIEEGTAGLGRPQGISFGPDGALYVTSCDQNKVIKADLRLLRAPAAGIYNFTAPADGTYYARVTGNGKYNLLVTRGGVFENEVNDKPGEAMDITAAGAVLGGLGEGGFAADDYFTVTVAAGDTLTLATSTPGDGQYEFANDLDPLIELYDSNGVLVAADDNGAGDGRNALLTWLPPEAGTYTIRLLGVAGEGAYVLALNKSIVVDPV